MNAQTAEIKTTFSSVVLRGSAYQIGVQQAQMIQHIPGFVEWIRSAGKDSDRPAYDSSLALMRRFCPGLEEETNGFCDTLKIKAEDLFYFASTHLAPTHCSHMVVLPSMTENKHTLVGRNYDFSESMDDKRLCSTYVEGKYAHIGFSSLLFGRLDGMNDQGLTITASVGGIPVGKGNGLKPPIQNGLQFWAVIRTLFEQCKDVDEALNLLKEIPNCGNPILLLADSQGSAARAEIFGARIKITPIDSASPQQYLAATNHYIDPEMFALNPVRFKHSVARYQTIQTTLEQNPAHISVEDIKELLSTSYPQGLCCHYYREFFGNLHAMVFDPFERSIVLTFGSPRKNIWYKISFGNELAGIYESVLPDENTSPDFWAVD